MRTMSYPSALLDTEARLVLFDWLVKMPPMRLAEPLLDMAGDTQRSSHIMGGCIGCVRYILPVPVMYGCLDIVNWARLCARS